MAAGPPTGPRRGPGLRLLAVALVVAPILALWPAPFVRAPGRAVCMPADPLTTRKDAFKVTVVYRLGPGPGRSPAWKPRTTIPTLASFETFRDYAVRFQLDIEAWLYSDRARLPLEACEGRWRPAVRDLAFDPAEEEVPSVAQSAAAFDRWVRPMERAARTRGKYESARLGTLTWAVWKGILPTLLPMSDETLRAFLWDCLAFEASFSVLKHAVGAIKAWHSRPGLPVPANGPGDYRRLMSSLARFQGVPRRLIFPIHAEAVRRLLLLPSPPHPACAGVHGRCETCIQFLHRWLDCLTAAVLTLCCSRCEDGSHLQSCDLWLDFDGRAGYSRFRGGAALNVKVQKNDQFRQGHQPRMGVARDPRLDAVQQLLAIIGLLRLEPRPGCTKRADPSSHCPTCPPLFPRWSVRAKRFDLSRQPSSEDVSASIVRGLAHVGFDTSLFSGISARRGGLSTAIEAGVPEAILWMQSGHAADISARRYVSLRSPKLLYRTWEAFRL